MLWPDSGLTSFPGDVGDERETGIDSGAGRPAFQSRSVQRVIEPRSCLIQGVLCGSPMPPL